MINFFKDNHFIDRAEMSPLPLKYELIPKIVHELFPEIDSNGRSWSLIGHVNINSLNFRSGDNYIKLIDNSDGSKNYVFEFPLIANLLDQHSIPTISFLSSKNNKYVEAIKQNSLEYLVYVQPYSDNNFYTGNMEEFQDAMEIVQKLKSVGKPLTRILTQPKKIDFKSVQKILDQFILKKIKLDLADPFEKFLNENLVLIDSSLEAIKRNDTESNEIFHCDLHPHNLLSDGKKILAVIDLESFVQMPEAVFEAFSIFKLSRKCISKNSNHLNLIRTSLMDRPLLDPCRLELIRRISLILHLHFEKNDKRFDQDLYKHVTGLTEAEQIFSR